MRLFSILLAIAEEGIGASEDHKCRKIIRNLPPNEMNCHTSMISATMQKR
jgi:hypothetical protein